MFIIAWMISLAVSTCYSIRLPPGVDSIYSLSQERLLLTAPKITELDDLEFPPAIRLLIHDAHDEPWIDYMHNQIQYLAEYIWPTYFHFLLIRGAPTFDPALKRSIFLRTSIRSKMCNYLRASIAILRIGCRFSILRLHLAFVARRLECRGGLSSPIC